MLLQQWHRKFLKENSSCIGIYWPLVLIATTHSTYFQNIYWSSCVCQAKHHQQNSANNSNLQIHFWLVFHLSPNPQVALGHVCQNLPQSFSILYFRNMELSLLPIWNTFPLRLNVTSLERTSLNILSNMEVPFTPYPLLFLIFLHCTYHHQICTLSILFMYSLLSRTIFGTH